MVQTYTPRKFLIRFEHTMAYMEKKIWRIRKRRGPWGPEHPAQGYTLNNGVIYTY